MKCVFSVDVEDWFHILDLPATPDISEWGRLPSLVERNFLRLLELFAEYRVEVTCFFLGWVAHRFPHLVKKAQRLGHEIASHGYGHQLVYTMSPGEFLDDIVRAKNVIEDAIAQPVQGYRAPGFSATLQTPWFFEMLGLAGYRYDCSVFPMRRAHGGMAGERQDPHPIHLNGATLVEFPATVTSVLARPVCLFGGGYFRLAPWPVIRRGARQVLGEGRPVVFYIHPREIDPTHPRLVMGPMRRFRSYVNVAGTEAKIRLALSEFPFTTFGNLLARFHSASSARCVTAKAGGLAP